MLIIHLNPIGLPLEDIAEEEEPAEEEDDGEVGEDDEMADFIVDEEFDATGVPVRYIFLHFLHADACLYVLN